MFHYMDQISSTGEPPTADASLMSSSQESDSVFAEGSGPNPDQKGLNEADSGYEASPSSTNGVRTFSFDGKPEESSPTGLRPEFEDAGPIMMGFASDGEDAADEDTDFEDLGPADSNSEADTENGPSRPSSSPIPIPQDSARPRPASSAGRLLARRAQPSPPGSLDVPAPFQDRHPLSWPAALHGSAVLPAVRPRCELPSNFRRLGLSAAHRSSPSASRTRSRRRLIDSDASSSASSDESNEAFDRPAAVPPLSGGYPVRLPDVVPNLMQPPNGIRRSRSISVNLPLDRHQQEVVRNIGRQLRMLSDRFQHQVTNRRNSTARRNTLSDIVRFTLDTLERRGHRDDDYDGFQSPNPSTRRS